MSQWAEIRHAFFVDNIPKKQIARDFRVDVKTVRRAIAAEQWPHQRPTPKRSRLLDPHKERIQKWLLETPRLSAKRIRMLLKPHVEKLPAQRTVREFVASLRNQVRRREVFVHRTFLPGQSVEFDFGESSAIIDGRKHKIKYLVGVLPASNAYFAKAYFFERLESLLDGILSAFEYFGGLPRRMILDNTSLAVREVLKGPERIENKLFQSFRGELAVGADFCAPGKGNEKGSVERGVEYVRGLCFRPLPEAESLEALNNQILKALEEDLSERQLVDGRTAKQAMEAERELLRPLPDHRPQPCRHVFVVSDKYAHIRVDSVFYSIPEEYCRQPLLVRLFHDRLEVVSKAEVIARHRRSFERGAKVLCPFHILPVLERKHRATLEATAIQNWQLPEVFDRLFDGLQGRVRKARQEWVKVLRLLAKHPLEDVVTATEIALEDGSPRYSTIVTLLRVVSESNKPVSPVELTRPELKSIEVEAADLGAYDSLGEVA